MNKSGFFKRSGILFLIGFFSGILLAAFLKPYYLDTYTAFFEQVAYQLNTSNINYSHLFFEAAKKIFLLFGMIWLLSIHQIKTPVFFMLTIFFGIGQGYFFCALFQSFYIQGLIFGILYAIPQVFIYVPVILLSMYLALKTDSQTKWKKERGMSFFVLSILLLAGVFLETFVNSFLIKSTIFLVS